MVVAEMFIPRETNSEGAPWPVLRTYVSRCLCAFVFVDSARYAEIHITMVSAFSTDCRLFSDSLCHCPDMSPRLGPPSSFIDYLQSRGGEVCESWPYRPAAPQCVTFASSSLWPKAKSGRSYSSVPTNRCLQEGVRCILLGP